MEKDRLQLYDFMIVGQGIAGTVLAHTLIKLGKKIVIVDDWNYSSSSKVAAGLYNPIVFKRLTKSWMIDELLPSAESFYTELEHNLNERFFYKKEIVKIFASEDEKSFWLKKAKGEELKKYLSENIEQDFLSEKTNSNFGAATVKQAGNVDVKKMLSLFREYLKKNKLLLEEKINYDDIVLSEDSVQYKNLLAKKIIFCEGFRSTDNPYFNWLPFKLTKGEILIIKLPVPLFESEQGEQERQCINKGVFILPLGNNIYKVGATYNWKELDEAPTEKGRTELIGKLNRVLKIPFEVIAHEAGIRPTVHDRRPLIGLHPTHNMLGVFNGLGTKGILLAPYFALHFSRVLVGIEPLNKEVSISRFPIK